MTEDNYAVQRLDIDRSSHSCCFDFLSRAQCLVNVHMSTRSMYLLILSKKLAEEESVCCSYRRLQFPDFPKLKSYPMKAMSYPNLNVRVWAMLIGLIYFVCHYTMSFEQS